MPERAGDELGGGLAQAQPHSGRSCLPGWQGLSLPPGLDSVTSVTSPSKGPAQALSLSVACLWTPTADPLLGPAGCPIT